MYCKKCGQELAPDRRFCRNCGTARDTAGVQPLTDSSTTATPEHEPSASRPTAPRSVPSQSLMGSRAASPDPDAPFRTPPAPATQPLYPPPPAAQAPHSPPPAGPPSRGPSGRAGLTAALLVLALTIAGVAVAVVLAKGHGAPKTTKASVSERRTTASTATVQQTTPTTTTTGVTTATQPTSTSASTTTPSTPATGPVAALRKYWSDIASGKYSQAADMESASEQGTDPESTMQAEAPMINVVSVGQPSSDRGEADIPINFWAEDTKATSFSDTQCRHFIMTAIMIQNSDRSWSYNGSVSGSATVTVANGNPNCHS
jgi:hypothetical protein